MKKKELLIYALTFIGIGLASVGVGYGVHAIVNKQIKINSGENITLKADENNPVTLKDFNTEKGYFLNKNGLELLSKRIKETLFFNQEIHQLNSITINDSNNLQNNVNGQYDTVNFVISLDTRDLDFSLTIDQKIDMIMPVIFHEYGHHIANMYINSNPIIWNNNLIQRLSSNNNLITKHIDQTFYNEFINSLNYTPKYNYIYSLPKSFTFSKFLYYYNDFSPYEIFEIANKKNLDLNILNKYKKNQFKEYFFVLPLLISRNSNEIFTSKETIDNLLYLYSLDELITRHYCELVYKFNLNLGQENNYKIDCMWNSSSKKNKFVPNSISPDVFRRYISYPFFNIENKNYNALMPFAIDNVFGENTNNPFSTKPIFVNANLQNATPSSLPLDVKLTNNTKRLYQAFLDVEGYGKLFSQIYFLNNSQEADFNKIRISGYLPSNLNNLNSIKGLYIGDKVYPFLNQNYKYKPLWAKQNLFGDYFYFPPSDYKEYITKDYIDFSLLENQKILFWNDLNNDNIFDPNLEVLDVASSLQLNNIIPNRKVTSFRDMNYLVKNNNFYYEINSTGMIEKKYLSNISLNLTNLSINQKDFILE